MKTALTALVALTFAAAASADTTSVNGCEVYQPDGANYYNFTDPMCPVRGAEWDGETGGARQEVTYFSSQVAATAVSQVAATASSQVSAPGSNE